MKPYYTPVMEDLHSLSRWELITELQDNNLLPDDYYPPNKVLKSLVLSSRLKKYGIYWTSKYHSYSNATNMDLHTYTRLIVKYAIHCLNELEDIDLRKIDKILKGLTLDVNGIFLNCLCSSKQNYLADMESRLDSKTNFSDKFFIKHDTAKYLFNRDIYDYLKLYISMGNTHMFDKSKVIIKFTEDNIEIKTDDGKLFIYDLDKVVIIETDNIIEISM